MREPGWLRKPMAPQISAVMVRVPLSARNIFLGLGGMRFLPAKATEKIDC
jgi:hypothetical protein